MPSAHRGGRCLLSVGPVTPHPRVAPQAAVRLDSSSARPVRLVLNALQGDGHYHVAVLENKHQASCDVIKLQFKLSKIIRYSATKIVLVITIRAMEIVDQMQDETKMQCENSLRIYLPPMFLSVSSE